MERTDRFTSVYSSTSNLPIVVSIVAILVMTRDVNDRRVRLKVRMEAVVTYGASEPLLNDVTTTSVHQSAVME